MKVGYQLKSWTISAWGKNILDKRYPIRGFYMALEPSLNDEETPDALYLQWGEPLHYGLTASYHF